MCFLNKNEKGLTDHQKELRRPPLEKHYIKRSIFYGIEVNDMIANWMKYFFEEPRLKTPVVSNGQEKKGTKQNRLEKNLNIENKLIFVL